MYLHIFVVVVTSPSAALHTIPIFLLIDHSVFFVCGFLRHPLHSSQARPPQRASLRVSVARVHAGVCHLVQTHAAPPRAHERAPVRMPTHRLHSSLCHQVQPGRTHAHTHARASISMSTLPACFRCAVQFVLARLDARRRALVQVRRGRVREILFEKEQSRVASTYAHRPAPTCV